MRILFDTSVWIEHFQQGDEKLIEALEENLVVLHPMVIGELVVGKLPPKVLNDLLKNECLKEAPWREVIVFIQQEKLMEKGLSWIDVNLLYSSIINEIHLITYDKILNKVKEKLDLD